MQGYSQLGIFAASAIFLEQLKEIKLLTVCDWGGFCVSVCVLGWGAFSSEIQVDG